MIGKFYASLLLLLLFLSLLRDPNLDRDLLLLLRDLLRLRDTDLLRLRDFDLLRLSDLDLLRLRDLDLLRLRDFDLRRLSDLDLIRLRDLDLRRDRLLFPPPPPESLELYCIFFVSVYFQIFVNLRLIMNAPHITY